MAELDHAKPLEKGKTGSKTYLYWGPPGTGKSTLAMQHPGNKFIIDADDKINEMENLQESTRTSSVVWSHHEPLGSASGITWSVIDPTRKNVYKGFDGSVPKPLGYDRIRIVTNELLNLAKTCRDKNEPFPYDVVIHDSMTATSDHLVLATMHAHGATTMTETLWGVVTNNLKGYIDGFLLLPCDRIIIMHDKEIIKRDKDTGAILDQRTRPMIVGQMAGYVGRYFSEAYYFLGRDRSGKYRIQTAGETKAVAPARTTKGLEFEQEIDPAKIYADFKLRNSNATPR